MIISVINHSGGNVKDDELQQVIRAVNRQIEEDFAPAWSISAKLRLDGRSVDQPDKTQNTDMRGDAVLYVWDESDVPNAIGYHDKNFRGIPYAFVFLDIAATKAPDEWTVTLSHEALELIADPEGNLLVMGPHPDPNENRTVFHWFEMCDAVQNEWYRIDGIRVSNFVLPLYFTGTRDEDETGARNDFLGTVGPDGQTLPSFGINPGGYVGFYDPQTQRVETFMMRGDADSQASIQAKRAINEARRSVRKRDPNVAANVQAMIGVRAAAIAKLPIKATKQRSYVAVPGPSAGLEPPSDKGKRPTP